MKRLTILSAALFLTAAVAGTEAEARPDRHKQTVRSGNKQRASKATSHKARHRAAKRHAIRSHAHRHSAARSVVRTRRAPHRRALAVRPAVDRRYRSQSVRRSRRPAVVTHRQVARHGHLARRPYAPAVHTVALSRRPMVRSSAVDIGWSAPRHAVRVRFAGERYRYHAGRYWQRGYDGRYLLVSPRRGLVVPWLPAHARTYWVAGRRHYRLHGVTYVRTPRGYRVVRIRRA